MKCYSHPASLPAETLLAECELWRQRRSGPGGQHRNKVETAVVLVHLPTGIRGEASERRSQAANRKVAIQRLRVKLALQVRSPPAALAQCGRSALWQSRVRSGKIQVSAAHDDFPSLLAEALDVLAACELDAKAGGEQLGCSPSQLVKLLKVEPEALMQVNEQRKQRNLRPWR
jgi:hypothetical protein